MANPSAPHLVEEADTTQMTVTWGLAFFFRYAHSNCTPLSRMDAMETKGFLKAST